MTDIRKHLRVRVVGLVLAAALAGGCATGNNPQDPFESFNRGVYSFNEGLDKAILKPVAEGYRAVLPQFIRSSVSNFFSNINDVVVALNNLLQGKFTAAYTDIGRVAINSTLGVLGLFDIASEAGIEKHDEDFGQTLGRWGVAEGPFIMLPFFGPSTGRDAVGRVGDLFTDPVTYVDPTRTRNWVWGTRVVNRRAELLEASTVLQTAALDPYEFVRDAYLQRRRNLIHDGAPPPIDRSEFTDPPPKAQTSAPRPSTFPSSADLPAPGSILVSGEFSTPVLSPYSAPAPVTAVALREPPRNFATVAMRNDGSVILTGDVVSGEVLTPGQLTIDGAAPPPRAQLPKLSELWRALRSVIQ